MKQNFKLILIVLLMGFMVTAASFAYWTWYSPVNKNIVFNTAAGLSDYVIYDEGESKFVGDFQVGSSYLNGIHSTVSISKSDKAINTELYATVNMTIDEIGEVMKVSNALKWTITTGDSDEENPVILNSGTFYGKNKDDVVRLYSPIVLTTDIQKFTVWLWLDEAENPSEELTGETVDVRIWTQIDQALSGEFSVTELSASYQVINATVVNSDANIVSYAVTRSNIEPTEWVDIEVGNVSNLYKFNYVAEELGVYYVWFKDSNGKTVARSVTVTEIDTNVPVVTIKAIKKDTDIAVVSDTWSNKGLNFIFETSGLEDIDIYYCMDESNTCEPSSDTGVTKPNLLVTDYNQEEGTYYVRYKSVSVNGNESELLSYNAKVGLSRPDGEVTVTFDGTNVIVTLSIIDPLVPVNPVYGWKISNDDKCDSSVVGFQDSSDNPYVFDLTDKVAGGYYVCVKVTDSAASTYYYLSDLINTSSSYDYTGNYQLFTAPSDGYYQLEVWGAEGFTSGGTGGYGGYSTGIVELSKDEKLYIYVGGTGVETTGGYNGGGAGSANASSGSAYKIGGGGGGASDIRLFESIPTEDDLVWNSTLGLNSRIIVAGGGGGGAYIDANYSGGNGGGFQGNSGTGRSISPSGGTQTTGNLLGVGQNGLTANSGYSWGESGRGGGGGGYYGGNASQTGANGIAGGGGGSGYIASDMVLSGATLLKHMTCYNCETSDYYTTRTESTSVNVSDVATSDYAKTGNGAAKISYLGNNILIDKAAPTGSLSLSLGDTTIDATLTVSDVSGLYSKYGWRLSTDSTCDSSVTGFTDSENLTYTFTSYDMGTNYICVRTMDNVGNIGYISSSIEIDHAFYSYTGDYQMFTAPESGYYQIEAWGAQGGSYNSAYYGGYGGYSTGVVQLTKDENIYIYAGGAGTVSNGSLVDGGYNGGGDALARSTSYWMSSGGGATHVATVSGLLSELSSQTDKILIVAGGGGGSGYYSNQGSVGGGGGGYVGVVPSSTCDGCGTRTAGSQTAGGQGRAGTGSFGQGKSAVSGSYAVGGGGGYYGGAGDTYEWGASGGSGYIANETLISFLSVTKHMTCYGCSTSTSVSTRTNSTTNVSSVAISDYAKSGNGAVKITNLNIEYVNYSYDNNGGSGCTGTYTAVVGDTYGELCQPIRADYVFAGWYSNGKKITSSTIVDTNENHTLTASWAEGINPIISYSCANGSAGSSPYDLEYGGNCTVINDEDGNWRVKLLSTGTNTLTLRKTTAVDVFLVGGGGGSGAVTYNVNYSSAGGAGGYTTTQKNVILDGGTSYSVTVGGGGAPVYGTAYSGGASSIVVGDTTYSAAGGGGGTGSSWYASASGYGASYTYGGSGGSGGGGVGYTGQDPTSGGSYGNNGAGGYGGTGQGTTTCEFGEGTTSGCDKGDEYAYSGGGAGGAAVSDLDCCDGGSGIVIIRNKR